MFQLVDFKSREKVSPHNFVFTGKNGPWEVEMDLKKVLTKLNLDYFRKSPPYVSKYLPFLPIENYKSFVSLGEGGTPLIRSTKLEKKLGIELYFKLETQNPTGSFKDRGSAVEISFAKEIGAKGIVLASTGNMAASCSCYAANAGIPCFIFVPEGTPPSKLAQVISYGGHIVQVKGNYGDASNMAEEVARKLNFYLAGDYALRVEGHKTAAFELIDQLFFEAPDYVIVPMGCGTNIASYQKGFREYLSLGFIEKLPKLIGAQAKGACPIINSVNKKLKNFTALKQIDTQASAIAINNPLDGIKALDAIYSSNGSGFAVTDNEMLAAQHLLAKEEGQFVELSSAATFAALIKLAKKHTLQGKKVICILTGSGLKDPSPILKVALKPPTIYPKINEFLTLYKNSFYKSEKISLVDRHQTIFSKQPTLKEIEKKIKKYFHAKYDNLTFAKIKSSVSSSLKKGRKVNFADFQDIVQDALKTITTRAHEVFQILDFEVTARMDKSSFANVSIKVNKKIYYASSSGVGPFDAIIKAIAQALPKKLNFELTSYKVESRGQGSDALSYVNLEIRQNGIPSEGTGASPDTIQASVLAFEDAYNELL